MQVSPTVVSHTRCKFLLLAYANFSPGFQDTSHVVFCDNLPLAAPSVRETERAARHFSAASRLNRWSVLVTALLRR